MRRNAPRTEFYSARAPQFWNAPVGLPPFGQPDAIGYNDSVMSYSPHTQPSEKTARRIAVVGDSIAAGYGLPPEYAWPHLLIQQLSDSWPQFAWQLQNASIPGDTTPDAYVRFDDIRRQRPDIVLIALGVNDCRRAQSPVVERRIEYFRRNEQSWWGKNPLLRRIGHRLISPTSAATASSSASQVQIDDFLAILSWMVQQVQSMNALPALLTLSPLASRLTDHSDFAACADYNTVIREIARTASAALIEVNHAMPATAWQIDGVHLTALGQAELAQRVFHNFRRPPIAPHLGLEIPASNAQMAPSLD